MSKFAYIRAENNCTGIKLTIEISDENFIDREIYLKRTIVNGLVKFFVLELTDGLLTPFHLDLINIQIASWQRAQNQQN